MPSAGDLREQRATTPHSTGPVLIDFGKLLEHPVTSERGLDEETGEGDLSDRDSPQGVDASPRAQS